MLVFKMHLKCDGETGQSALLRWSAWPSPLWDCLPATSSLAGVLKLNTHQNCLERAVKTQVDGLLSRVSGLVGLRSGPPKCTSNHPLEDVNVAGLWNTL